jgi:hypothetical protein
MAYDASCFTTARVGRTKKHQREACASGDAWQLSATLRAWPRESEAQGYMGPISRSWIHRIHTNTEGVPNAQ